MNGLHMFRNNVFYAPDGDEGGGDAGNEGAGAGANNAAGSEQTDYKKLYEGLSKTSQKAYAGLQKTLQTVQDELKGFKESHSLTLTQLATLQAEHATTQSAYEAALNGLNAVKPELDELKMFKGRMSLILKDFPDLIGFEAEGLLPQGKIEELTPKLTAFRAKLGSIQDAQHKQNDEGSTPPPPGGAGGVGGEQPTTADGWLALANKSSADGHFELFDKYFNEYLKMSATTKK